MFHSLLIITVTFFGYLFPQSGQIPDFKISGADFEESEMLQLFDNQFVWLYLAGDHEDLSSPDVPVADWNPISLGMYAGDVPDDWDGIGWFKTTFQVDSALMGKEMGIQGRIYGAMEVYLNGERIGHAGKVGTSSETEETTGYFEPIVFTFDEQEDQHFAIRYSNHNYRKGWNVAPAGLLLTMGYAQEAVEIYHERRDEFELATVLNFIQMGFFIALALLHFILFFYYPDERANLIYGFMLLCVFFSSYYSTLLSHTVSPEQFIRYLTGEGFFVTLFSVLNLYFAYEVTKRKINWLPVLYSILSLPIIYIVFADPLASRPFALPFFYASLIISIFLFTKDRIKKKKKSLNVIILAYTLFFILILPRTFWATFNFDFLWAQSYFTYALSEFLIPIGYSVYLAKRVATTNKDLKQKLTENEELTQEKLKIEQEKQQLINRQKQKLEQEVTARTADLQKSLEDLKAAQEQLVQQEKLASLGQLTAGIAHEIKNPLNFVNNFSDISLEMIDEALEELQQIGENEHAAESAAILADIRSNLAKIHEHGSRADGIVKSMLMHSRGGDGKMEPTDLNELVKEYVKLAFHGMRAGKDPIGVDIKMDMDNSIGEIPLVAEDFSRVMLNLCNNAFDAMRDKLVTFGTDGAVSSEANHYTPRLAVRTQYDDGQITIEIEDNGPGIPDDIIGKILQPFFTTKKGTQGTGLGLSITNDIIKAHGGSLEIESGSEGSAFKILLPG